MHPGKMPWKHFRFNTRHILLTLLCAISMACTTVDTNTQLDGNLPVLVQRTVQTGEKINITVGPVEADNGTQIGLIAVGAHGPKTYQSTFSSGMAHFVIPELHTGQPGYMALIVAAGAARGEASVTLIDRSTVSTSVIGNLENVRGQKLVSGIW